MYEALSQPAQNQPDRLISEMERELFAFLKVKYQVNNIKINEKESIHTVYLPSLAPNHQYSPNYYVSHGFGGTALMSFAIIQPLLQKGNVIFWEIRGMGFSAKLNEYPLMQVGEIEQFYLKTIEAILLFYKHQNCTFISHSFSSYLLLLFCIRFPQLAKIYIKKLILLSAIGITPKEEDYKNSIHGISDLFDTLLNKFGWAFNLTYKSPLRTICACCKQSLIRSSLKDCPMTEQEQEMLLKIILTLILLPDGSEDVFFKFFEPRVIPKVALEPLLTDPPEIVFIYGGQQDWVDKTGAKKLTDRFPKKISFRDVEGVGHNIPFNKALCQQIFGEII